MGRLLCLVLALFIVGCGGLPDPREGTLVLSEEALEAPTLRAIDLWSKATNGDTRFRLARTCPSGESCARIAPIDGEPTEWGGSFHQHPGAEESGWAEIAIARWTLEDPDLASNVIAHELGHFLWLADEDVDTADLMNWKVGPCITKATLDAYNSVWGTSLSASACLRDQDEVQSQ